jgi:hypothetical protein
MRLHQNFALNFNGRFQSFSLLFTTKKKPHQLNCFFASAGYGAYQKALADAFQ